MSNLSICSYQLYHTVSVKLLKIYRITMDSKQSFHSDLLEKIDSGYISDNFARIVAEKINIDELTYYENNYCRDIPRFRFRVLRALIQSGATENDTLDYIMSDINRVSDINNNGKTDEYDPEGWKLILSLFAGNEYHTRKSFITAIEKTINTEYAERLEERCKLLGLFLPEYTPDIIYYIIAAYNTLKYIDEPMRIEFRNYVIAGDFTPPGFPDIFILLTKNAYECTNVQWIFEKTPVKLLEHLARLNCDRKLSIEIFSHIFPSELSHIHYFTDTKFYEYDFGIRLFAEYFRKNIHEVFDRPILANAFIKLSSGKYPKISYDVGDILNYLDKKILSPGSTTNIFSNTYDIFENILQRHYHWVSSGGRLLKRYLPLLAEHITSYLNNCVNINIYDVLFVLENMIDYDNISAEKSDSLRSIIPGLMAKYADDDTITMKFRDIAERLGV